MALILGLICLFSAVNLVSAKDEAVVFVVDPGWDCTESYVANVPLFQEYKVIKVMTNPRPSTYCNSDRADIYKTITWNSSTPNDVLAAAEICPKLKSVGFPIAAVIPTFDPAVYLADMLAACLGVRGNPVDGPLAKARRDKWVMSESVRKAGLRSVKEKIVSTWPDAREYLESLSPPLSQANPVIFKILQGSSSEGVEKVYNLEQAEETFNMQVGNRSTFGDKIGEILIQEFLRGKEYVIDSASRDGVHKVVMVWHEDLRPGNGIPWLYFGFKSMDPEDQKTKAIIDYANKVLNATGLRNGAADMEVIWLEDEGTPCVVDLNARWTALMWHDGLALERAFAGHDQITATANAYLDEDAFNNMPLVPAMRKHAAIVFNYARVDGILSAIPGLQVATKMASYFGYNRSPMGVVGKPISITTKGDPPVTLLLAHKDKAVLDADYNRIIALENSNAFYSIVASDRATSGSNPLPGLPSGYSSSVQALAVFVMLAAAAAVVAHSVNSRQKKVPDDAYLAIE